jgi:hypothetical protein
MQQAHTATNGSQVFIVAVLVGIEWVVQVFVRVQGMTCVAMNFAPFILAQAGSHNTSSIAITLWIPAFAGMTSWYMAYSKS